MPVICRAPPDGRDAAFPGWVLGAPSYCRTPDGLLVVTPTDMYSLVDPGPPPTHRDIPVERLTVITTRTGTWADAP